MNLNDYAWGANGLDDVISQVQFQPDSLTYNQLSCFLKSKVVFHLPPKKF